jgi:hypothetical protein
MRHSSSRFQIPDSRFQIPDFRFQVPVCVFRDHQLMALMAGPFGQPSRQLSGWARTTLACQSTCLLVKRAEHPSFFPPLPPRSVSDHLPPSIFRPDSSLSIVKSQHPLLIATSWPGAASLPSRESVLHRPTTSRRRSTVRHGSAPHLCHTLPL